MPSPELTSPDFKWAPDVRFTYRGRDFSDDVLPQLKNGLLTDLGEDDTITDAQLVFVGYSRAADCFLVGFDVWLPEPVEPDDENLLAGHLIEVRLTSRGYDVLAATRFDAEGFYDGPKQELEGRVPDLVELVLD